MNRGLSLEEKLFSEQGRALLGETLVGTVGQSAPARVVGVAGPHESDDCGTNRSRRTGSQEATRSAEMMTHPGVGPLTALAYVLIIGTPTRFERGKQIGTYVGMRIPSEDSSAGEQQVSTHQQVKAIPCCASCWWRRPKQQRVAILTGDVGTSTWRCVGARALPR